MGLFDGYQFDQGSYGGGGLIDRLLSQLQTQGQYQPSQGFGANPMDASAQPIAVGDYQMPRIGNAQQFTPDPAALPPNAQPTQGQMPPQMAQPQQQASSLPQFLQPPGTGPGDRLLAGLQGFGGNLHNGLISALVGGAGALATGQRTDPVGQQRQVLQAQYKALLDAGVPPAKAQLALLNPEAAKTILPDYFGADNFSVVKTGQSAMGQETYQRFSKKTGEFSPISGATPTNDSGGIGNMDLTGKEYLASIPTAQRGTVQGMVEGTIAPPSSFALSKPYWQNMIAAAKNYDPTFDATNWSGRLAGVKDFSAGKSSEMVRSANQTLHHTGQLLDSMDALNNGNYPLINKIGNAANEATGGGAPTAFRLNAHAVAEELSKVFKGQNLSDTEIRAWEQNLHENMSPEQQRAAVGKLKDLLHGSLHALDEKRVASIGQVAADKAGPIIKPEGQAVLQRIDEWLAKGRQGSATGAPGQTKTGVSWSVVQ